MGFTQTTSDPCLYIVTEGEMFVIVVYVDDILLAGKSNERFDIKDMGELHYFLGVRIKMEVFGLVNLCIHKTFYKSSD